MKYTIWLEQDIGGGRTAKGYLNRHGELVHCSSLAAEFTMREVVALLPTLSYEHTSMLTCKIEVVE